MVRAQYAGCILGQGAQIDWHLCFATVTRRLVQSEIEPVTTY